MDKLKVRFQDGPITVTQLNYRGYEIHTYTSPNRYSRYIYKIGEVLDTVYDTNDRTVTVEDCKQIIDRLNGDRIEQLSFDI